MPWEIAALRDFGPGKGPLWAMTDKTQSEHNKFALPPIGLQSSLLALPTRNYRIREVRHLEFEIARFGSSLNQYCASGVPKIGLQQNRTSAEVSGSSDRPANERSVRSADSNRRSRRGSNECTFGALIRSLSCGDKDFN